MAVQFNIGSTNQAQIGGSAQTADRRFVCMDCTYPLIWVEKDKGWWCENCKKYSRPHPNSINRAPAKSQAPVNKTINNPAISYQSCSPNMGIHVEGLSVVGYQGPKIIYKVKVVNNEMEPICDVKVTAFVPSEAFLSDATQKVISLLQPAESNTVTFYLRPTGECGKRSLASEIDYFDYSTNCRKKAQVPPKDVEVVCPVLKPVQLPLSIWKQVVAQKICSQDSTGDIPVGAQNLYKIINFAFQSFNLHTVAEDTVQDGGIIHKIAWYSGRGVKGLDYCACIEVLGSARVSKILLTCYASDDAALTGFHHALLDIIEKRTKLKQYITDKIVIQHIHGDMVCGNKINISDSVINRSDIG